MSSRLPFRSVTSRQNPIVSRFREAARRSPGDAGVVLIEGETLVREAARAGWRIQTLAVSQAWLDTHAAPALTAELDGTNADCIVVPHEVLTALSPARTPSGVVALAQAPERRADPFAGAVPLVAIVEDVQDPGNVGAVARAAEAAGATGLVVCGRSADPFGWKALRGSMGSAFRLPIERAGSADEALVRARDAGLRVAALTARGGTPLHEADLCGPIALVVGGEGAGLRPELVQRADVAVTVPMQPPVESLNAAVAAAVVLYETARQRSARGSA